MGYVSWRPADTAGIKNMTGVRLICDVASDESSTESTTVAYHVDGQDECLTGGKQVMCRRLNGSRLHPFIFRPLLSEQATYLLAATERRRRLCRYRLGHAAYLDWSQDT